MQFEKKKNMFIRFYVFRFIQAMLVIPQKLYEQFTRKTIQYLGPVFTAAQNFVFSGKKLVNGKPFLECGRFFPPTKIFSTVNKLQRSHTVENIWRPTIFCQATKSFVL